MAIVSGMKVSADAPQDSLWSHGWNYQYVQVWPEDRSKQRLFYEMDRREYEKIKTKVLHLHVDFLLSAYQQSDVRNFVIPAGRFRDETLGVCRLNPFLGQALQCLKEMQEPGVMGDFTPQNNVCTDNAENGKIAHAFVHLNSFEFPRPILNPVIEYSISFDQSWLSTDTPDVMSPNQKRVRLCPGAEIRLGRPEEQKKVRVQFDLPEVRLHLSRNSVSR
jgi:hypothetical protein